MNSIDIQQIRDDSEKIFIADNILRNTPEWLANQDLFSNYIVNIEGRYFFTASEGDDVLGFVAVKRNNPFTAEIIVTGILDVYNRKEVCRLLIEDIERYLAIKGYKLMIYNNIHESKDYEFYLRKREMYRGVGFYPIEETSEKLEDDLPIEIMVKPIYCSL